ncbi:hypothetical protein BC833DRAFT_74939 [Globomyces pollinis-pini]|nr:hypothetical protein BC833DRAFT_74939 [Globomyces pollinis-pini]
MLLLLWLHSNICTGPPSSMYSFDVADSTLTTPTNESWPSFYSFGIMENNQNICGSAPLKLEKSCCISSLDLELSASYSSGVMIDTPTTLSDPVDKFSARGDYCALQAKQSIDLWGYNAIYILANGHCINDTFRCANNGELSIYSSGKNCQGGVKVYLCLNRTIRYVNCFASSHSTTITIGGKLSRKFYQRKYKFS